MDGSLDFAACKTGAGFCFWVIGTVKLDDLAVFILDNLVAGNEIGASQADFIAREETEVFFNRNLHKV